MIADGISQGLPFHDKDLQIISERILSEGTSFVQVTLPLLGRALDHGLVTGQFICPANFAMKRETRLPRLFFSVFNRVIGLDGRLLDKPCTLSIFFLRQVLLFDSKLITEPSEKQKDLAVQGFRDRQDNLRKIKLNVHDPVLLRAQWLLGRVLSKLDLYNISPGHGPGAVAEKKDRDERWDFTSWPLKAEREYPYIVYGVPSMIASLSRGTGVPLVRTMKTRCCLVPKDFRGPRLISAEPTVNQYLQQGQMKAIMQYVASHRILSRSIKMRDQTFNQERARLAYENGDVTLDLSDASDTVSTVLLWFLLKKVPVIRRQLMSTRSDYLSHNGKDIKIIAFAPMGSATCFPVESIVFWALAIASMGHCRRLLGLPDSLEVLSTQLAVFGDDIIIPEYAFSTLCSTLHSVGCRVNTSKTCYQTPFRESCGTEWYNGLDVTIIRNRRYHYVDRRNISDHPALISLQRKFFVLGLYRAAKLCEQWAREIFPVLVVPISRIPSSCPANESPEAEDSAYQVALSGLRRRSPWCELSSRCSYRSLRPQVIEAAEIGEQANREPPFGSWKRSVLTDCDQFALDSFPACLGWQLDVDVKLPVRFNRNYQRMEFRVPQLFQQLRDWTSGGYSRLFARLSLDQVERFVVRNRKVRMTWAFFPGLDAFTSKQD